jgi:hypothetical protein
MTDDEKKFGDRPVHAHAFSFRNRADSVIGGLLRGDLLYSGGQKLRR